MHIKLHSYADKYGLTGLQSFADRKFSSWLTDLDTKSPLPEDFLLDIRSVFKSTLNDKLNHNRSSICRH